MRWNRDIRKVEHVADLMREQSLNVHQLARIAGVDEDVVEAIAHERYTPTARQRERISAALGVDWRRVCWGHRACVENLQAWGR